MESLQEHNQNKKYKYSLVLDDLLMAGEAVELTATY